jgi:hypothetical protein
MTFMRRKKKDYSFYFRMLFLAIVIVLLLWLDYTYLRKPEITVFMVRYNPRDAELKVTLKNQLNQTAYVKAVYTLSPGQADQAVGDMDYVRLSANEEKTLIYDVAPWAILNDKVRLEISARVLGKKERKVIDKIDYLIFES